VVESLCSRAGRVGAWSGQLSTRVAQIETEAAQQGGQWLAALQWVMLWGVLAVLAATYVGRWRFVKTSALRPALDI